ncbi:MAG: hypothetical protein GOV02_02015, partial [Candidatus Aenigmarchaeota archaeon]|nr:hypothetical protein [Candidatus Aenigmarchaeota archaeon]
ENGGNVEIDVDVNGTSVFDCPTNPDIAISHLKWNYSVSNVYGSSTALTTTASPASSFDLGEDQLVAATSSNTTEVLYWGMGVPFGVVGGQTCDAQIRVAAIQG